MLQVMANYFHNEARKWGMNSEEIKLYIDDNYLPLIEQHYNIAKGIHVKAWLYWWGCNIKPPLKMNFYEARLQERGIDPMLYFSINK